LEQQSLPGGRRPVEAEVEIAAVLTALRKHLGMEVGFISEFFAEHRQIRFVTADREQTVVRVGDMIPLDQGYCQRIVDGRLPELMADTALIPEAIAIAFTRSIPVGAHMGVAIRLASGELYGTLCCFRATPNRRLDERDLGVMRAFAEIIAGDLHRRRMAEEGRQADRALIEGAIADNEPAVVYQPIVDLRTERTVGLESLARFGMAPRRSPDQWFAAAEAVGMGVSLELNALRNASGSLVRLPGKMYLSLNCSPALIRSGRLAGALAGMPLSRIVLEVTEHAIVDDFEALHRSLQPLREGGLKLAMDDAGAGFSSLQHLMQLRPEVIKLDLSLARVVDGDATTRALVAALVAFANETGASVVAEGVEGPRAASVYRKLGVHGAQGYYFARPMPLEDVMATFGAA
jgi:EAL domain-containing protein (putative c-di-GMP-specific phosphodiesterase class I)